MSGVKGRAAMLAGGRNRGKGPADREDWEEETADREKGRADWEEGMADREKGRADWEEGTAD